MAQEWAQKCSWWALVLLSMTLFISFSASALYHVLLIFPGFYFLWSVRQEFRIKVKLASSSFWLMALVVVGIVSILLNIGEIPRWWWNLSKLKYFVLALLGIAAFRSAMGQNIKVQQIRFLILLSCVSAAVATFSGLIGLYFGWNPLRWAPACHIDRACGMYGMYMSYGYGMGLWMVLQTGILIYCRQIQSLLQFSSLHWKILYLTWMINLAGLYFSYARGALLGFLVAIPFFFYKQKKRWFFLSLLGLIGLVALGYQFVPAIHDLFHDRLRITSVQVRLSQFQAAWVAFKTHPFFGVGFKNFEPLSRIIKIQYNLPYYDFGGHAHNNFLEHLASTGGVGFVAFILFHVCWCREMYRREDVLAQIIFPFICALIVSGQFQYTMGDGENLFLIMTIYSLSQVAQADFELKKRRL